MGWNAQRNLYESIAASGITSEVYNVASMKDITLQLTGSPSTTTVQGSNDDGRESAPTNWSTITGSIGAGIYDIEHGFRWLRCQRSETTAAIIAGWQRS